MRLAPRTALILAVALALVTPAAHAADPTAPSPQPAPGSAFGPLQSQVGTAQTETTVTATERPEEESGRQTLLLLSIVALAMIGAVVGFIWWEGRRMGAGKARKRRQRLRSGRTPEPMTAATGARRGPPPPPRKRRAQAKRKKR